MSAKAPEHLLQFPFEASVFKEDVKDAIQELKSLLAVARESVVWDGNLHDHVYSNDRLQALVSYLSAVAARQPSIVMPAFEELGEPLHKEHWFVRDSQTAEMSSRTEVFDLIAQEVLEVAAQRVASAGNINPKDVDSIGLKMLIKQSLTQYLLQSSPGTEPWSLFDDELGLSQFVAIQNSQVSPIGTSDEVLEQTLAFSWPFLVVFGAPHPLDLKEDYSMESINLVVNGEQLSFKPNVMSSHGEDSIEQPQGFDFSSAWQSGELNYLVPFVLTESLNPSHKLVIIRFFKQNGFDLVSDQFLEDTHALFKNDFNKAHHLINISNGDVSDENILVLPGSGSRTVFEKRIANPQNPDEEMTLRLFFYSPPTIAELHEKASNLRISFSKSDVAEMIQKRYQLRQDRLCVFPFVCESRRSVKHWIEAAKRANYNGEDLLPEGEKPKTPIVVAADRSFDGESLGAQLSHAFRIMQYVELTSSGSSLEELRTHLSLPSPEVEQMRLDFEKGKLPEALADVPFAHSLIGQVEKLLEDVDSDSFNPACSTDLEFEHLYQLDSGVEVKVERLKD